MSEADLPGPTPSTLLFLFADELLAVHTGRFNGTDIPCRGVAVSLGDLAARMLTVSFLSLRDRELVTLEVEERKRLLRTKPDVGIARIGAGNASGLEGELHDTIGARPTTVSSVVRDWFGGDHAVPEGVVTRMAVAECEALGYIRAVDLHRSRVARLVMDGYRHDPDCERIAGIRPAFDEITPRWERIEQSEDVLWALLLEECDGAIQSRRMSTD